MKKIRKSMILTLSIFIVTWVLFGFVPQSYAQDDQGWTEPVNLSQSGIATNPFLVIDSENVLHAIWVDEVDGYKYSQSVDGKSWTKPKRVSYPFDKKGASPVLLADSSGSIQIFWIGSNKGLFHVRATSPNISDPAKWQSGITRLAQDVVNFDVVLDSQGALHIAYVHNASSDASPAGVYYRQLPADVGTWSNEAKLYESDYFRSATESESSVRIATSNVFPDQRVYVVWDIRPQKRVFMAVSNDSGLNWDEAQQIKGVDSTRSADTPFNLNIAATNDKVLIMWQAGEPGTAKCAVFSQWSQDNGQSWGDIVSVLGGFTDCPIRSKFIIQKEDYIVAMLTGQVDPTLIAWNGEQWSVPQTQTQLPVLSNPLTYDAILLGCRFDLINQDHLYVVGCDQGGGGDVWFLSRSLESVDNWFSLPKTWGAPIKISMGSDRISSFVTVSDSKGVIHSIWVQSSLSDDGSQKAAIEYTRWDGKQWTRSEPVISSLGSIPSQISFAVDSQGRLLLSWVDEGSGELLFSWVNSERANLASEWEAPVSLPSSTNLISSPDIVVDGSGRIVVVYAISLNEDRGVYVVQSTDSGESWSSPVRVFDAVSARWEKIGNPKISLGRDGVLHLIFSRISVRTSQPVGLYYSRSLDGGMTWSDSQILSEGDILWSDIVSYADQTIHVMWQEYDGLVYANLSQVSQDSGTSWGKQLSITGVSDSSTPVAIAANGLGDLYFVQLLKNNNVSTIKQDSLILQDWRWTGSNWEFISSSNLVIKGQGINYDLTADFTSTGFLGVSVSAEYSDPENTIQNEILTFNRFLEEPNSSEGITTALLPTPVILSNVTETPDILPTQSMDVSVLYDDNVAASSMLRNIIGMIVIGIAMVVTTFLVVRGRSKTTKK